MFWIIANVQKVSNDTTQEMIWKVPFCRLAWLYVQSMKMQGVKIQDKEEAEEVTQMLSFLKGIKNGGI